MPSIDHTLYVYGVHPARDFVTKVLVVEPVVTLKEQSTNELVMHLAILSNGSSIDECIQAWAPPGTKPKANLKCLQTRGPFN